MRIPIRMIGVATTIFWVILLVFSVSAIYSVRDVSFNFGEPKADVTSDNKLLFSMPVTIANGGYYNVGFLDITTIISDDQGVILAQGSTLIPVIKKDEKVTITHNVTIDVNGLFQNHQNYVFDDATLKTSAIIGMRIAEVIPAQASTNSSIPWGAPLYNFALGEIEYTDYNGTCLRVIVPISFENHAFFDLGGGIQLRMYNSTNSFLGESQTAIVAQQNSDYNGFVDLCVSTVGITESGHFEAYFVTPFFDIGPLVIPYG